ncbi:MAG: hypothetical protein OJF60_001743 [Burkholderiaceae bacterium]|jgi:hypothetical protein|nr:MAG: hypothetical protein OJF60_001743 [Burkholderiaceae bacterium]
MGSGFICNDAMTESPAVRRRTGQRRVRGWRSTLLAAVLLCFLLLTCAEVWHHDRGNAPDPHCGLCQVAAHQPLDFQLPTPSLPVTFLRVIYVLSLWQPQIGWVSFPLAAYRSRAPPQAL